MTYAQVINEEELFSERTCRIIGQQLSQWFLGLQVNWIQHGNPQCKLLSGFAVKCGDWWFWVTAGHVTQDLEKAIGNKQIQLKARWVDLCPIKHAESIPVSSLEFSPILYHSDINNGIDFGFLPIRPFEVEGLLANPEFRWLDLTRTVKAVDDIPPVMYIVGSPEEWQITKFAVNGRPRLDFSGQIVAIPIRLLSPEDDPSRVLDREHAFSAEIMNTLTHNGNPLESIVGTSGGPVFAAVPSDEDNISCCICAIQSSWRSGSRRITATRLSVLGNVLRRIIRGLKAAKQGSGASTCTADRGAWSSKE